MRSPVADAAAERRAAQVARAQGALMGVMVADAAGAHLEGKDAPPTASEIEHACGLPEGRFVAGGVTDDSELTLALALALLGDIKEGPLLERCACNYIKWRRSPPTSMGRATNNAFSHDLKVTHQASEMMARSALMNQGAESNGALMRAAPWGIALHAFEDTEIASIAALDSQLSHPSRACQDANAAYSIALAHLIQKPGDEQRAVHAAKAWVEAHACASVRRWMADSESAECPFGWEQCGQGTQGWVRWAFTIAFWHLRRRTPFMQGLHEVLSLGGDTDTNAAICCGLLGALWGVESIPAAMRTAVLTCEAWRPEWLLPRGVPQLAEALLQLAERQLSACNALP